jgi:epoxyqueuosine reductase
LHKVKKTLDCEEDSGLALMNQQNAVRLSEEIRTYYFELLESLHEMGDIGFTRFKIVFDSLMSIQQEKLKEITGLQFESLLDEGSMISIGIAYHDPFIDFIDSTQNGVTDYSLWNQYAMEYHRLNQTLNRISKDIAVKYRGIPLKATIGGEVGEVSHVSDYFGMVISHRVVAENAGIGWRGKNQLTIHEEFSCALRFASIIVPYPLDWGHQIESKCGNCIACEEVCGFIRNRDMLPDFRENCRRYILFLKSKGIEKDICGKCIKACYRSSRFSEVFSLPL